MSSTGLSAAARLGIAALWLGSILAAYFVGCRSSEGEKGLPRPQSGGWPRSVRQLYWEGTQQSDVGSSTAAAARMHERYPATHHASHQGPRTKGFYVHQNDSHLLALARADPYGVISDKFTQHTYEALYGRLFELAPGRRRVHRLLEIGLGCNQGEGPAVGASARLWRRYLPQAEIWFAEYDAACVKVRDKDLKDLDIKVVIGDQEDPATLKRWANETGGDFDVIIDDGGHTNAQQLQSFLHLFQLALKPGGAYVIEDLAPSKAIGCDSNNPRCAIMAEKLLLWSDVLLLRRCEARHHPMPPGIRSIEFTAEAVVVVKCFAGDATCDYSDCVLEPSAPPRTPMPPAMTWPWGWRRLLS